LNNPDCLGFAEPIIAALQAHIANGRE